jgi:formate-dependent nitrite reductase membrane component NrfD
MFLAAEHFVRAPAWEWYILGYFFLAGLSGGSYAIATLLRHWGGEEEGGLWRLGFLASLPLLVLCPILLTIDLGQPLLFWHMMVNTTPGGLSLNFKYWSPMSVGVWALALFGVFSTVSFVEALVLNGVVGHPLGELLTRTLGGVFGRVFNVVGAVFGLFIASYTGVLLMVSNQPVWSDSWALGGLFLASSVAGSAALLALLVRSRGSGGGGVGERWLQAAEGYFAVLELALAVIFLLTLVPAGSAGKAVGFPWLLLWLLVLASMLPPLALAAPRLAGRRVQAILHSPRAGMIVPVLVLIGVLALRAAVIFST